MLAELGLEYETKDILPRGDAMNSPEFRALSERGKIPLFEDGELMIGESAAIVLYLADRYRDLNALVPPPGTDARARHADLCFFIMTEMDALLYVLRRHEGPLSAFYGESEVACNAARAYFLRSAGELERRLADGQPYLVGELFCVADLLLKTCLDWARFVGIQLPDSLESYSQTIAQRPAYTTAMRINFTPAVLAALAGEDR
jgi:glutathione S-transferase